MSGMFRSERIVVGRKPHRCDYCRCDIPAGAQSVRIAGYYEEFYVVRGHVDCMAAWEQVYDWLAGDEGIDVDLARVLDDTGEWDEAISAIRGHYPHVVARLELVQQKAEIKFADRRRALGIAPNEELHS